MDKLLLYGLIEEFMLISCAISMIEPKNLNIITARFKD